MPARRKKKSCREGRERKRGKKVKTMQEKRVANCHKNSIGPENNGLITEISIVYMRVITNMRSYFFAHFLRDIFSASYPTSSQPTFFSYFCSTYTKAVI